jgi:hypothetical protein
MADDTPAPVTDAEQAAIQETVHRAAKAIPTPQGTVSEASVRFDGIGWIRIKWEKPVTQEHADAALHEAIFPTAMQAAKPVVDSEVVEVLRKMLKRWFEFLASDKNQQAAYYHLAKNAWVEWDEATALLAKLDRKEEPKP